VTLSFDLTGDAPDHAWKMDFQRTFQGTLSTGIPPEPPKIEGRRVVFARFPATWSAQSALDVVKGAVAGANEAADVRRTDAEREQEAHEAEAGRAHEDVESVRRQLDELDFS
jgi:hypothetical protein